MARVITPYLWNFFSSMVLPYTYHAVYLRTDYKREIFGLSFHRREDGGNKKIFHAFFTQMIYGQMAIFCKPYTTTQQRLERELSCVALKNETKALDELF